MLSKNVYKIKIWYCHSLRILFENTYIHHSTHRDFLKVSSILLTFHVVLNYRYKDICTFKTAVIWSFVFNSQQVTIKFDKNMAEPADRVVLHVTADPGSLVNVLAVDKSILLLRSANDITAADVCIIPWLLFSI